MKTLAIISLAIGLSFASSKKEPKQLSDKQIKKILISESIESYPGNCPCPYNAARNGSACGGRSAWSRGGGYSPLCYDKDVTKEMIQQWRESNQTQEQ